MIFSRQDAMQRNGIPAWRSILSGLFVFLLYLGFARFLILNSSSTVNPVEAGCLSGSIDDSGIIATVTPLQMHQGACPIALLMPLL